MVGNSYSACGTAGTVAMIWYYISLMQRNESIRFPPVVVVVKTRVNSSNRHGGYDMVCLPTSYI